jgi:hypothetical protein
MTIRSRIPGLIFDVHPISVGGHVVLKDGSALRELRQDVTCSRRRKPENGHPSATVRFSARQSVKIILENKIIREVLIIKEKEKKV